MSNATILIVEDTHSVALQLQSQLQSAGYRVLAIAGSSEEALDCLSREHPDLVLLNLHLEGHLGGTTLGKVLRDTMEIPVVYQTDALDRMSLKHAQLTQPFGYLLLPATEGEILRILDVALAQSRSQTALRQALQQQQAQCDLKSRLIAIVSHEFRNPLNSIVFSTGLLDRHGKDWPTDKRDEYFGRINTAVQRLNHLLDDVLTLGETESGEWACRPEPIALVPFCQALIEELQPAETRKCPVVFTDQVDLVSLLEAWPCLDERLLRHILGNLLSNAIKYSLEGQRVFFDLTFKKYEVVFRIQDQGIGIPLSDQAKLFHEFHRASNARTIPGTGLGLSIVKQCVELHGGRVEVSSEVNQGSTFTVTIPVEYVPMPSLCSLSSEAATLSDRDR